MCPAFAGQSLESRLAAQRVRRTTLVGSPRPMNEPYFRCEDCKRYIEAGHRTALRALIDAGLVTDADFSEGRSTAVSAGAVLGAQQYWQDSDGEESARAAYAAHLTRVRAFLHGHSDHRLSFGDCHTIVTGLEWLDWLSEDAEPLPRHFSETLGLRTWGEVEQHVQELRLKPWWWRGDLKAAARHRFEELTQGLERDQ